MIDSILISDKSIFGTDMEQEIIMDFFDGYAIEVVAGDNCPLKMTYPTIKEVFDPENCLYDANEILNFCGLSSVEDIDVFNIAIKYGKLIR